MAYQEFDGELDEPTYTEFSGKLDAPRARTWGEAAADGGRSFGASVNNTLKTLTDLAREMNYQPSRYEAHLEARLAEAEAMLRDARSSIPGNAKFTLRRIDAFLRAGVTTVTVTGAP